MDGARPVYNYYHASQTRRPSTAARRSTLRSQASGRSRRRASSARSSRNSNLMDRQSALILMYGIYFFYVLACFGAISTFAGLMLRVSSKQQPDSYDKGKIITGIGIGTCCTCFLVAFYCRSVKLDDKIFESIKETAPIVEIDDLILQRVGSTYRYNPHATVERRPTISSTTQKCSWWQMRRGDADEISIYSGGGGTRPGSAASSVIGQGSHAYHPHIIIPRGLHHAEYIPALCSRLPASDVCSSNHSSPLHCSSPGPQTPLSYISIDIPEEPGEIDLERPSTSRLSVG